MTRQAVRCGTYSGYTTHLHRREPACEPCRAANRDYFRARRAKQTPLAVDPRPAAEHIARLKANGATNKGLARETGLNYKTFRDIEHGRRRYITADTEQRILAATGHDTRSTDATGTRRRLTALIAIGWSQQDLGRALGVTDKRIGQLVRADRVERATADAVTALYDRLSMRPGTSKHARAWAERHGYIPPLAYDDETIDDPGSWANVTDGTEVIDPVVVERLCANPLAWREGLAATRAERIAAARILGGSSWKALGYSGTTFAKEGAA